MCCNPTVCFKIRVIKFKYCCSSAISQTLLNFKSQFCPKEEVGDYDNIALNQRIIKEIRVLLSVDQDLH